MQNIAEDEHHHRGKTVNLDISLLHKADDNTVPRIRKAARQRLPAAAPVVVLIMKIAVMICHHCVRLSISKYSTNRALMTVGDESGSAWILRQTILITCS
jgi:hypothetical protein